MCAALASPYQEAQTAVHEPAVKNADESSWSENSQKHGCGRLRPQWRPSS